MENIKKIINFINSPIYGGDVKKAIDNRICVLCERKVTEFEYFEYLDSGICEKCRGILSNNIFTYLKKDLSLKQVENAN